MRGLFIKHQWTNLNLHTFSVLCYKLGLLEGRFVAENASHQANCKILVTALFHLLFPEGQLAFVSRSALVGGKSIFLNVRKVSQYVFEKTISVRVAEPFDLKIEVQGRGLFYFHI
jgi:hypothetical protein